MNWCVYSSSVLSVKHLKDSSMRGPFSRHFWTSVLLFTSSQSFWWLCTRNIKMAMIEGGGMKCIKYMLFAFNLIFLVSRPSIFAVSLSPSLNIQFHLAQCKVEFLPNSCWFIPFCHQSARSEKNGLCSSKIWFQTSKTEYTEFTSSQNKVTFWVSLWYSFVSCCSLQNSHLYYLGKRSLAQVFYLSIPIAWEL